jgi:hypothetical protein
LILPPALLGLGRYRRWGPGAGLLCWAVVVQAVAILPFFVNARFRLPLVPLLALFAAAGAWWLVDCRRRGDRRALTTGLAVVALLFVVVNVDWFDLGADRWLARDWFNQGLIQARPYGDRQPDQARAEENFRRAVALGPDEVDFSERLGALLLGRAQPLVKAAATATDRRNWNAAAAAGERAEPLLVEARRHHGRAAEIFPRSFRSWTNLGVGAKWLGDLEAFRATAALARDDSTSARTAALAALRQFQYSVQDYQQGLEINPGLEDSKRSINEIFRSVMALPGLDPSIVEFQRRAAQSAGNRNQRR